MNNIEKFLAYLRFEKRFSAHTLLAYETDLIQFKDYLVNQYQTEDLATATHFYIRSWVVSLMDAETDARSVGRKITTLRSFYRFLVRNGTMERSPMLKVQAPKVAKRLPEYIDEPRMEQLLETPEGDDFETYRNWLIMDFFYRTGVRRAELIGLKLSDVNLYNLTINVLGKRNKVRQIPITNSFRGLIEKYLQLRATFLTEQEQQNDWFFVDNKGNQMYPVFVYRLVKSAISKVSTGKKKSPHVLRHTFATTMLNHGADINAIKEILGHASLAATQVYTHNSVEKLREIYKQAFPKA